MNDLVSKSEKMMGIKEIAGIYGVSYDTINNTVKRLFPEIIKNGKKTLLNEIQVACISKELKSNSQVINQLTFEAGSKVKNTTTEAEIIANYKQATEALVSMLNMKNQELKAENDNLKIELDESKEWTTLQKYFNSKGWETDRSKLSQLSKILGNLGYERKKIYSVEYERGLWSYRIKDLDEYFLEPEF